MHFAQDEDDINIDLFEWKLQEESKKSHESKETLDDFLKEKNSIYDIKNTEDGQILVTIKECGHQYKISPDGVNISKLDSVDSDTDDTEVGSRVDGTKIILSDKLPEGTYTLKYEDANGPISDYDEICTINTENGREYDGFIKENIAPVGSTKIGVYKDGTEEKVETIELGSLDSSLNSTKKYSFAAFSDIHMQNSTRIKNHCQGALEYVKNHNIDFTVALGDFADSGTEANLESFKNYVDTYAGGKKVYAISGNHEPKVQGTLTMDYLRPYTGQDLYYSFEYKGDVFILVGLYKNPSKSEGDIFLPGTLEWLQETLEKNRNKRCFLFMHLNPENGSGDAIKKDNDVRIVETVGQGKIFYSLIRHYTNLIWFHGHTHEIFQLQELNKGNNYDKYYGCHSVHVPSIGWSKELVDGSLEYNKNLSQGYIVDVYEDKVVLKGMDWSLANEKAPPKEKFLPIATYLLDTKIKTITENSYTGPTEKE